MNLELLYRWKSFEIGSKTFLHTFKTVVHISYTVILMFITVRVNLELLYLRKLLEIRFKTVNTF